MTKKEYVEKAKNAILNRVRFHAPIVFDGDVDLQSLKQQGVDTQKPIFKFDKKLDRHLVKAFLMAKKEEDFNLLLDCEKVDRFQERQLSKTAIFFSRNMSNKFLEGINKLNINYPSSSNYNLVYKDKFVKLDENFLNLKFEPFALSNLHYQDEVLFSYREFVLNGNCILVKLQNNSKETKKKLLEINLPLHKGYYFFKRQKKSIFIENLITKSKFFFNFLCKNAKFSFSNVNGLENSLYCCVNVLLNLTLKPNEEKVLFFNFGTEKFVPKNCAEMEKFFAVSQKLCREVFNVKVKTKNPKFDNYFNKILPHQIWINWVNGESDLLLEQKYQTYKKLFVRGTKKMSFVRFKQIGLRELGLFNGSYYKKIVIVVGTEQCLKVGKTNFYNTNDVTEKTLKKREPISLCFGC